MKTKFAISLIVPVLIMLGSTGCVTSTNTYTRDIVYRDGSYYSPADEQYGDYYYEPEPDYSYYDDNYYGFNSGYYGNSWYGNGYSSGCRFSYRFDRYCDNGRGGFFQNFNGLTIFFGNSNHYGYGNGYGYGHHDYYGGYPHYGWYSPRPRPRSNDPIPMPKPGRPSNSTPDYSFNNGPGMRVPGESVRTSTKPGLILIDQNPVERIAQQEDQENLNPYTRTREPRPNSRPETWRNDRERDRNINAEDGIIIRNGRQARPIVRENYDPRLRTKPALLVEDAAYESAEKPIRHNRRPQPYPRAVESTNDAQSAPGSSNSYSAPPERARRDNHQERPAPRVQQTERIERAERIERPVREVRQETRQENGDGGNGVE